MIDALLKTGRAGDSLWSSYGEFQKWVLDWVNYFRGIDKQLQSELIAIKAALAATNERVSRNEKGLKNMSDVVADLKAEYESFKADVTTLLKSDSDKITALEAQIAAIPPEVDTSGLTSLLAEMKADHAALVTPVVTP